MAHGVPLSVMHARHTGNTQEKKTYSIGTGKNKLIPAIYFFFLLLKLIKLLS